MKLRSIRRQSWLKCSRLFAGACLWLVLSEAAQRPACAGESDWTGGGGDGLWSTAGNWLSVTLPSSADRVVFTNAGFAEAPLALGGAINNTVDSAFAGSISALGYMNINGFHNTSLARPLALSSGSAEDVVFTSDDGHPAVLFVGSGKADEAADAVYASIAGTALSVTNANADLSVMQTSAAGGAHRATLDLSGLSEFICVVSNVLVGHDFGIPVTRPTGTLILATSNSISAERISIGDAYQNAGAISYIHLGQVNNLNVDRIRIALHKCVGTMDFTPDLVAPSVTFRNRSGGRQISWEIGDEYEADTSLGFYTSNQSTGTLDLTGGSVDALVDRIILGRGQTNALTRTGDGNGTFVMSGGLVDVNVLEMGVQISDGGSVGRGTLTLNTDDPGQPSTMLVRSNIVMATQMSGNIDTNGSSAVINLNGGFLSVAGDIQDGAGISTINISNGGRLDLKPDGDATAGNIAVDNLNITDGSLVHFGTLAVSTVTLGGATTEFNVDPGQTIAPAGVGAVGTMSVTGDLKLRGTTAIDVSKTDGQVRGDHIAVSGTADLGGVLEVHLSGNTPWATGDKLVILSASAIANSFTTANLPSPGPGLTWTNRIDQDGTIEVIAGGEIVRPSLTVNVSATAFNLAWPAEAVGYLLRAQTNSVGVGISTNWSLVPGVSGNAGSFPIDARNGAVFFQLIQPQRP